MKMLARLRHVATADFRKSERTNFNELPRSIRGLLVSPNDVICFHSNSGNQVVFVYHPETVNRSDGTELEVVASVRLRLPVNRRWDPMMIADYAADVGLELVGLKKLKDVLRPFGGSR
jgi:hypothetical protein